MLYLFYTFLQNTGFYLSKIRRVKLWMGLSLIIYTLSVSGMVYCIIRTPPLYKTDRRGLVQYFDPNSRTQNVYEGLIIGFYNTVCAICIIVLGESIVAYSKKVTTGGVGIGKKNFYSMMVFALLMFIVTYRNIRSAYAYKNGWYNSQIWF